MLTGHVIVVGSSNYDRTSYVRRLPQPGETLIALETRDSLGGKGANQSVAASILGPDVLFLTALGEDPEGTELRRQMDEHGIDVVNLLPATEHRTGTAAITVDDSGENVIVVSPGANGAHVARLTEQRLRDVTDHAPRDAVLVSQAEVPAETIVRAADAASRRDLRFILNLAPFANVSTDVLALADPLVVNESEAAALIESLGDRADASLPTDPEQLCSRLANHAASIVVTLGDKGAASLFDGHYELCAPNQVAQVIDTTGAGDAFVGVLAAGLAHGMNPTVAVRLATYLSAMTITQLGAASSYAAWTPQELERALEVTAPGWSGDVAP